MTSDAHLLPSSLFYTMQSPNPPLVAFSKGMKKHRHYATLPITKAASPSSSARTEILVVTPDLAEKAIFTSAATFPPYIDLPYSLSVCVLFDSATSVPSKGWRARALASCSVAST